MLLDSNEASAANDRFHLERRRSQFGGGERRPLQIVRLFAPEAVQSQHENVTLGKDIWRYGNARARTHTQRRGEHRPAQVCVCVTYH